MKYIPEILRVGFCLSLLGSVFAFSQVARAAPGYGEPVVYKEVDGQPLNLYIAKPTDWKQDDARAALVFIHGGGWVGGGPSAFNEQARYLTSRGMVCISIEYRLLGKKREPPAVCIEDSKSAFRWVRAHAQELGIDPHKIAAVGASAGGHLAAALAMIDGMDSPQDDLSVSCRPDALVLYNAVIDNGPDGYGYKLMKERYLEFSPMHNVRGDIPPTLLFIGTEDSVVSVDTILEFERKIQATGSWCEAFVYEGLPHSVYQRRYAGDRGYYLCLKETEAFFEQLGWIHGPSTLVKPPDLDD